MRICLLSFVYESHMSLVVFGRSLAIKITGCQIPATDPLTFCTRTVIWFISPVRINSVTSNENRRTQLGLSSPNTSS